MEEIYDLIIIGSGPAGLSAAIYAQRAKLTTLVIEASYVSGGQVVNTYEVDNYPGLPGERGAEPDFDFDRSQEILGRNVRPTALMVLRGGGVILVALRKECVD